MTVEEKQACLRLSRLLSVRGVGSPNGILPEGGEAILPQVPQVFREHGCSGDCVGEADSKPGAVRVVAEQQRGMIGR